MNVGANGVQADSTVLKNTKFYRLLQSDRLNLPVDKICIFLSYVLWCHVLLCFSQFFQFFWEIKLLIYLYHTRKKE